jgi:hypothetical protein
MKVSSVLCTYGRHACVERSIGMWLSQDYKYEKELIVFNTAPEPLLPGSLLSEMDNVFFIHAPKHGSGKDWESLGEVRNAALQYCSGFLYSCWDDDDLFLPWHLSQGKRAWRECGKIAWKPEHSLFSQDGGRTYKLAGNSMEASFLVRLDFVKEHGFSEKQSGAEHVQGGWLDKARELGEVCVENIRPSYAYVWGDGLHKTSGAIDNPNNFEHHKAASTDFGEGVLVVPATLEELKIRFAAAYSWE